MKAALARFLFRALRNRMVILMRTTDLTWATINKVLKSFGQQPVTHYMHQEKGIVIYFQKEETNQPQGAKQ